MLSHNPHANRGVVTVFPNAMCNMSAPPRTRFASEVKPVATAMVVFDAAAALDTDLSGLKPSDRRKPIFDLDLDNVPDRQAVESALQRLPAFAIGLIVGEETKPRLRLATEAALVIALLSRRAGRIFVRSRTPDYTAGFLLEEPFTVEDWGFVAGRKR